MRKRFIPLLACMAALLSACATQPDNNAASEPAATEQPAPLSREELKAASFEQLFKAGTTDDLASQNVFDKFAKDNGVLTAGTIENANSMIVGWGAWGILYGQPSVVNMLNAKRFTLEKMREQQKYTIAFFSEDFRSDIMAFGTQSGRDSNKMKDTKLTLVQTPGGMVSYKEASLILECTLSQATTMNPEEYYNDENRKFVTDAYEQAKEYHKVVVGQISNIWVRK